VIIRFEGTANYTIIHLSENKCLLVAKTLKYFEEKIPHFLRISKADIVNPVYIESVIKLDPKNLYLQLKDGKELRIARRRITLILTRIATL